MNLFWIPKVNSKWIFYSRKVWAIGISQLCKRRRRNITVHKFHYCTTSLNYSLSFYTNVKTSGEHEILTLLNCVMNWERFSTQCPQNLKKTQFKRCVILFCNNFVPNDAVFRISLRIFLSLPVKVGSGQRSFLTLKLIKTYNLTMAKTGLERLGMISFKHEISQNLDYIDFIYNFANIKARTVSF